MRTRNVTTCVMALVLCLASSPVLGDLIFNDGGVHNIDYWIGEDVQVDYLAPGMQTTINLLDGGSTGSFYNIMASRINISGGSIGGSLGAYDRSQVHISGGSIGRSLVANDTSQVHISGGSIDYLHLYESSRVDIYGGSIAENLDNYLFPAGQLTNLAILTIHGSDFTVNGVAFGYGELFGPGGGYSPPGNGYQITGMLVSGELIDNYYYIGYNAKIILIPEPATLLLLGFGAVIFRRKRYKGAE